MTTPSEDDPKLDEAALKARVVRDAQRLTEKDAQRLVEPKRQRELEEKFNKLPAKLTKLVNQVKLLYELVRAYVDGSYREVPWASIAMAVAATLYFLSPLDLIPDVIPVIGLLDDALVVRFTLSAIQSDLRAFCEWKSYDLDKYFD
jgi:uncharacterized membrane protein YkvA (DUF1232 family)